MEEKTATGQSWCHECEGREHFRLLQAQQSAWTTAWMLTSFTVALCRVVCVLSLLILSWGVGSTHARKWDLGLSFPGCKHQVDHEIAGRSYFFPHLFAATLWSNRFLQAREGSPSEHIFFFCDFWSRIEICLLVEVLDVNSRDSPNTTLGVPYILGTVDNCV